MSDRTLSSPRPFCVGLTGGIASGKSTVCDFFAERGIEIIDADIIAREVVAPEEPALAEIVATFGSQVVTEDGELDRRAVRNLVFSDPNKRKTLESILHPAIRRRMFERAARNTDPYLILAVPLLVEGGLHERVDRVLVVDVTEEEQIRRLVQRDGVDVNHAKAILASQVTRDQRLAAAHDVIDNSGPLAALEPQVDALHRRYLELAGSGSGTNRVGVQAT